MTTTTTKPAQRTQMPPAATSKGQVAVLAAPRLLPPEDSILATYDVNREGWRTLTESIFPAAKTVTSVMMALDYCKRRKLDIFKHPVHIVPIWNSQAGENGKGAMVETIWPGINELRTTAIRTGQYAGMDVPVFGPSLSREFEGKIKQWENGQSFYKTEKAEVTFPEWCQITVYRTLGGNRVPFPGPRTYWLEAYARLRNDVEIPNSMWQKRANGQLEKCAEAAALRRAFPEELGSDYSIDEIGAFTTHAPTDITPEGSATTTVPSTEPKRDDFKGKPASPEAPPQGAAGGDGQPEVVAGEGAAPSGQPAHDPETGEIKETKAKVTDVTDENDKPLSFETYTRAGDFFIFADSWLVQAERTEAELVAFGAFYADYMNERLDPDFRAKPVHEAMVDTKKVLTEVLKKAQAPQREPGQEG